jgi:ubiquinone biosynthesis protein Coq4
MEEVQREAGYAESNDSDASPIAYYHGRKKIATPSSVLISSSPFLNDIRLREWITTETLRRNGADYPLLFGIPSMVEAIEQGRDADHVNALIAAERRRNPKLDQWFGERFISSFTLDQLGSNPSGSIGRLLFEHMNALGLSPELTPQRMIDPEWTPATDIEFFTLRFNQVHDFFHILGEVGFDVLSEIWPTGLCTANIFKHISPDLAGEMLRLNTLTTFPWFIRTMLHYPAAWPTLWRNLSYGYEVGEQSDLLFTARFEDVLHLSPAEARDAIGMRGVDGPVSSVEGSLIFGEGRTIL